MESRIVDCMNNYEITIAGRCYIDSFCFSKRVINAQEFCRRFESEGLSGSIVLFESRAMRVGEHDRARLEYLAVKYDSEYLMFPLRFPCAGWFDESNAHEWFMKCWAGVLGGEGDFQLVPAKVRIVGRELKLDLPGRILFWRRDGGGEETGAATPTFEFPSSSKEVISEASEDLLGSLGKLTDCRCEDWGSGVMRSEGGREAESAVRSGRMYWILERIGRLRDSGRYLWGGALLGFVVVLLLAYSWGTSLLKSYRIDSSALGFSSAWDEYYKPMTRALDWAEFNSRLIDALIGNDIDVFAVIVKNPPNAFGDSLSYYNHISSRLRQTREFQSEIKEALSSDRGLFSLCSDLHLRVEKEVDARIWFPQLLRNERNDLAEVANLKSEVDALLEKEGLFRAIDEVEKALEIAAFDEMELLKTELEFERERVELDQRLRRLVFIEHNFFALEERLSSVPRTAENRSVLAVYDKHLQDYLSVRSGIRGEQIREVKGLDSLGVELKTAMMSSLGILKSKTRNQLERALHQAEEFFVSIDDRDSVDKVSRTWFVLRFARRKDWEDYMFFIPE